MPGGCIHEPGDNSQYGFALTFRIIPENPALRKMGMGGIGERVWYPKGTLSVAALADSRRIVPSQNLEGIHDGLAANPKVIVNMRRT